MKEKYNIRKENNLTTTKEQFRQNEKSKNLI